MKAITLLTSSAFMMMAAMFVALITNFCGWFPGDVLDAGLRSNLTILTLMVMLTLSMSRIPMQNLNPLKYGKSMARAILLGMVVASIIPLAGYLLLKDTEYAAQAAGLVFIAATPFAGSVLPLSIILRGDAEHAARGTIVIYILSLIWIPFIVWLALGDSVDMQFLIITVIELIGVPLVLSRVLARFDIGKETLAVFLNCCIFFMVWLSVGSTNFAGNAWWIFLAFLIIAALRSFGLGTAVEVIEKRAGILWGQRVTDILMTSYKNKGVAIALCVALYPPGMVAIATSILVEITWVAFMDSVLFSKKRMERELASEGSV
ncbi:MAG: Na+-dependent transporter [Candidatus Methanomethylophilaceae archaeon]|nr:Na+-dependent transporter [Candidatus Methanomethylophilaceae archaeon]